ncbi:hypothetical protein PUN28_013643 [Cardiocondyla obscurior]|uniref:Secreted protein n=1 Tax=Cardiocondyla obscurior TaxID=286306 RepID=A0AAW2F602_9HYME
MVDGLVFVFETVESVEDDSVAARRFTLVEGDVVVGTAVVVSALLVRQQVAAGGDLGSAIQIPTVERREAAQVVVEFRTLAIHPALRVVLVEKRKRVVIDALWKKAFCPERIVQQLLVHVPRRRSRWRPLDAHIISSPKHEHYRLEVGNGSVRTCQV